MDSIICFKCKWFLDRLRRAKCNKCFLEGCIICIEEYFNISLTDNQLIEKIVVNISLEEKNR